MLPRHDVDLVYTGWTGHGTCVLRYRTGDLCIGGVTTKPCPHCGRTVPRIASELRRVSEQHALHLTKVKGTLVDLSAMGSVLMQMPSVEEWQVVLRKHNDDPLELDVLDVRFAPRGSADTAKIARRSMPRSSRRPKSRRTTSRLAPAEMLATSEWKPI